jgi:hypothetical protein
MLGLLTIWIKPGTYPPFNVLVVSFEFQDVGFSCVPLSEDRSTSRLRLALGDHRANSMALLSRSLGNAVNTIKGGHIPLFLILSFFRYGLKQ